MKEGEGVLVECPGRWYLGIVQKRSGLTVVLKEALCAHYISDLGMFLDGKLPEGIELTPLPRGKEINLSSIDSVEPYPIEFLRRVRKRSHSPTGET